VFAVRAVAFGSDDAGYKGSAQAAEQQRVAGLNNGGNHGCTGQQKITYNLEGSKHDSTLR
jgi:hypothetical protein